MNFLFTFWGMTFLFAVAFLEAAGGPIPYELVFLGALFLIDQGALAFWQVYGLLVFVNLLGNLCGYFLAARLGRGVIRYGLLRSRIFRRFWREGSKRFRSGFAPILIFMRWTGFGFGPALWLSGIRRIPLARFLGVAAVMNIIWIAAWLTVGQRIALWAKAQQVPLALALAAAFLVFAAIQWMWKPMWKPDRDKRG